MKYSYSIEQLSLSTSGSLRSIGLTKKKLAQRCSLSQWVCHSET